MDIILLHDAAIDEYMAQLLIQTMPVNLLGVVIVNADCIDSVASQVAFRIQSFIGKPDVPLGLSRARGWNPFPWKYRQDCVAEGNIGSLACYQDNPAWPPFPDGDALLEQSLDAAADGVTLLVTCPFTPLSDLLKRRGDLSKKIGRIIWMGGAIRVSGNIDPATVPAPPGNGCAEWNAFWDPASVDWILRNTDCEIVQFPLDMTNQASVASSFMAQLQEQARAGARWSQLAWESYQIVASETFYDMWDVVTTCWLASDEQNFFEPPTPLRLVVGVELDRSQGCLREDPSGREVQVVFNFAKGGASRFYEYVAAQLNR
jgi:purine nucleosidase